MAASARGGSLTVVGLFEFCDAVSRQVLSSRQCCAKSLGRSDELQAIVQIIIGGAILTTLAVVLSIDFAA